MPAFNVVLPVRTRSIGGLWILPASGAWDTTPRTVPIPRVDLVTLLLDFTQGSATSAYRLKFEKCA